MYEINRSFIKRATEKSTWDGRVSSPVNLFIDDKGAWYISLGDDKRKALGRESIEYLMEFSLQSLQDAYAGAESLTDATAKFDKKFAALVDGTIGVRTSSGGVDDETAAKRFVVRKLLKSKGDETERTDAEIDAIAAKNEKKIAGNVAARMQEVIDMRAAKARAKAAAAAVDIEI